MSEILMAAEKKGLKDFILLMQEVAELPQEQQEKVTCYAQGVIAATNAGRKKTEE